MDRLALVQRLFREIFEDDALTVTAGTTQADVDGWDSLAHLKIILSLEEALGIRFETEEVATIRSVAGLLQAIERHT